MSGPAAAPPARRPDRRLRVLRWAPAIVWAAIIFALSSVSKVPTPPVGITDKHAHLTVYAVFGALLVWGLTDRSLVHTTWRTAGVAVVLATVYGASDEWHQSFVPGRQVSALDLAADAAGAAIAAVALRAWAIIRARR